MNNYYLMVILALLLVSGCRSTVLDDPSTIISYSLPQTAHVKLTVENNYNTEIAVLVDADQNPGMYRATFNATGLLEGVYYYTLECKGINNNFYSKVTKYMLLIK